MSKYELFYSWSPDGNWYILPTILVQIKNERNENLIGFMWLSLFIGVVK